MGDSNKAPELAEQQSRRVALPVARHVRRLDGGVLKETRQGHPIVTSVVRLDLVRQGLTQVAIMVRRAECRDDDIADRGDGPSRRAGCVAKQPKATSELQDVARHLFVDISRREVRVLDIVLVGAHLPQKRRPLVVRTNEQIAK